MNRKGQALVEFVLILPIFILLLFVIVDFGMVLSKKNELENISVDVVEMLKSNSSINDINGLYSNVNISIDSDEEYTKVVISSDVDIMSPILSRILGKEYVVKVERVIPNVQS